MMPMLTVRRLSALPTTLEEGRRLKPGSGRVEPAERFGDNTRLQEHGTCL
jgi:hypothetical protein